MSNQMHFGLEDNEHRDFSKSLKRSPKRYCRSVSRNRRSRTRSRSVSDYYRSRSRTPPRRSHRRSRSRSRSRSRYSRQKSPCRSSRYNSNRSSHRSSRHEQQRSNPRDNPERFNPERNDILAVFGLDRDATENDLYNLYKKYGCKQCKVIFDKRTGKPRGFGFVYFSCVDDASRAKHATNGKRLLTREIRVDYSIGEKDYPSRRSSNDKCGHYSSGAEASSGSSSNRHQNSQSNDNNHHYDYYH